MNWEADKLKIVDLYFDCIETNNKELFSRLDNHYPKSKVIYPFVKYIDERLSTVWFLALNEMHWDADIIDRSVLESLIKLIFIVNAPTEEEQNIRLKVYWHDLLEINALKHSENSKRHLANIKDKLSQFAHLPLILSDEEEEKIRNKWNRKDRKSLEQKWSFTEMLFSLKNDYKGKSFPELFGLIHEYKICSHIAHGDETGIGIISERRSKTKADREIVNRGHFIKLLGNCLAYATWLSITAMDFIEEKKDFFFINHSRIGEIKELEKYYHEEVFNSPDYDKYR